MDQCALLESRVVCQMQELAAAEESIDQIPSDVAAVVRNRLAVAVTERRAPLKTLRRSLASPDAAPSVAMHWLNYLERQTQCCEVFEESLPVLQGIALRLLGWDRGLCQVADKLLTKLAHDAGMPWDHITLMAVGEEFRSIPQVIWIRYPAASIWDLPIAAHELGHYLGPRLEKEQNGKTTRPLQDLLNDVKDAKAQHYLHETMADAFAIYTLGPAYAYTCLLSRFDPATAYEDGDEHPSAAKRSHAILRTLERLDGGQFGTFSRMADSLRRTWDNTLALFGDRSSVVEELGSVQIQSQDEQVMYRKLDGLLANMRYNNADWQRCQELAQCLPGRMALPTTNSYDITDVLNAAWLARIVEVEQGSRKMAYLGRRALEICQTLAN